MIKELLSIFIPIFQMFAYVIPILFIPIAILWGKLFLEIFEYKKSTYYQNTKLPYFTVRNDLGRFGEYHTYKKLKKFESVGAKFLFNVYIPKENGETSEIDVLMISSKGIFVFESKNYSGWIFGSEAQKDWYQTLPKGRGRSSKEHFYNPVLQNRSHIKHLKEFVGENTPMWSMIVFSERCTLKNVKIQSEDIRVVNRYDLPLAVSSVYQQTPNELLSQQDILVLYDKLYPCTQVGETVKEQHILNIQNNLLPNGESNVEEPTINAVGTEDLQTEEVGPNLVEKQTQDERTNQPQTLKCPRCGKDLVLRTSTRGANAGKQFYGCSGYPKCRYIQNQ